MKHKVFELEGALLDAAVAKAEGVTTESGWQRMGGRNLDAPWSPTFQWADGGPIIERERIMIAWLDEPATWIGVIGEDMPNVRGPTPLIAAMRAYVASKFGDEVDLP